MGTNYTRYNRRRLEAPVNNINRIALLAVLLAAGGALVAHVAAGGQSAIDPKQQALLKRLFPAATALDRKSTRLNSSHSKQSRMPSSA